MPATAIRGEQRLLLLFTAVESCTQVTSPQWPRRQSHR